MTKVLELRVAPEGPLDVEMVLDPVPMGGIDPCAKVAPDGFVRAMRTEDGDATLELTADRARPGGILARAYGDGAQRALDCVPFLLGLHDNTAFTTEHRLVRELARRSPGLRLGVSPSLVDSLVMMILQQRVKWTEATRSYAMMCRRFSERAPGPHDVLLPPPPERLARLSGSAYLEMGVEARRADAIRAACSTARALEQARANWLSGDRSVAVARIAALPSVGPWTIGMTLGYALGDADALVLADLHLPHQICFALAREPRGSDERMQELLAPFAPQRFRVTRLLRNSGISAPKYAPRLATRRIR